MVQILSVAVLTGALVVLGAACEQRACSMQAVAAFGVVLQTEDGSPLPADLTVRMCANELCGLVTLDDLEADGPDIFCRLRQECAATGVSDACLTCGWALEAYDGTVGAYDATASGYAPAHATLTAVNPEDGCHAVPQSAELVLRRE